MIGPQAEMSQRWCLSIWCIALSFLTVVSVIGLIGHGAQRAPAGKPESNDSIFQFYEFPGHPGLTHLCRQRVYGSGHEITWDAFASSATPSRLVDDYRQKLGDAGLTRDGEGASWRLPADAPRPNRVLEIMAIGTKSPAHDCEKSPPSGSAALVMLSRMY